MLKLFSIIIYEKYFRFTSSYSIFLYFDLIIFGSKIKQDIYKENDAHTNLKTSLYETKDGIHHNKNKVYALL